MRPVQLSLLLLVLLAPARADAATLSLTYLRTNPAVPGDKYYPPVPPTDVYSVRLEDHDGQANRIVLGGAALLRVRDDGAPIEPGPGCSVDLDGWAGCTAPQRPGHGITYELGVAAGSGDDTVAAVADPKDVYPPRVTIDLGAGDDSAGIQGAVGSVDGGPGNDAVRATGAQAAIVWDGGPGADRASGGAATVTYATRSAGVRVTPDGVPDDGEPDEGDDIGADVRKIIGGAGADELHSSGLDVDGGAGDDLLVGADMDRTPPRYGAGPEHLVGGAGDDVLLGRGGSDRLEGGDGDDTLDGGDGNDGLTPGKGADRVSGGAGDDVAGMGGDGVPDVFDGGDGHDTLGGDDLGNMLPLTVTLDGRADDGVVGEGDNVRSGWEDVSISSGRIVGDDGPNNLSVGLLGVIDGRGGDDVLKGGESVVGGSGRDRLDDAGAGGVIGRHGGRVDVRDGEADDVRCSAALVRLRRDPQDRIVNCHGWAVAGATRPLALRSSAVLPLPVRCQSRWPCRGRLRVWANGVTLARAPFAVPARGARTLRLAIGRKLRVLRHVCGSVRVILVTTWGRDTPVRIVQSYDVGTPSSLPASCPTSTHRRDP